MRRALVFGLLLAACGGGNDDDDDVAPDAGDPATVELRGECSAADRLGGFLVQATADLSSVGGTVENKPQPVSVRTEVAAEGDCRLLRRENPFCDPSCGTGEVCSLSGLCVAQPEPRDVGIVTVDGLLAEVEMTPVEPGYNYFATQLPHPAFEPNVLVALTSTPGAYGELKLHGVSPQPLTVVGDEWTVEPGGDLEIAWAPPAGDVRTTVHVEINIDQHGATPVTMVCDFDDTGTATIPASLTDALFNAGTSGFPRGSVARRTVDSQDVSDGCIELVVSSLRTQSVVVVTP